MLKRSIKVTFRLNPQESLSLKKQVERSCLSQESYLRTLINGFIPRALPPIEYHDMMRELHAIGNNLNQIAAKANATGHIDRMVFSYEANRLRKVTLDIQEAVTGPKKRVGEGEE